MSLEGSEHGTAEGGRSWYWKNGLLKRFLDDESCWHFKLTSACTLQYPYLYKECGPYAGTMPHFERFATRAASKSTTGIVYHP